MKKIMTQRKAKWMKKSTVALCTGLCMAAMLAMTAFAADISVNSSGFMADAEAAVKAVLTLIGGGIGILGVINLISGYSEENPASRQSGMKQLAAGIGVIIAAQTLVGTLFGMVSGL